MKIYLYFFNLKKKSLGNALHGKEKLNYDFDMREREREYGHKWNWKTKVDNLSCVIFVYKNQNIKLLWKNCH